MLKQCVLISAILIVPSVFADDTAEVKDLKKGMPQDVTQVIDRVIQCNRWDGEETSTKERAEQVKKELEKWSCSTLAKDQEVIVKRYANNYEVKTRIQNAQYVF
jgi:basic membrane lipoprotein Med (substrate-binding protein (PBP1-ABC) superfamily)